MYIGLTSQTLEKRYCAENKSHVSKAWEDLKEGSRPCLFHKAIMEFGADHFIGEILEDNIETIQIANEREVYWITHYKANDPKIGYNMTVGGGVCNWRLVDWLDYEEAKKYVHPFKFSSYKEYKKRAKLPDWPINIPLAPHNVYTEWESFGKWFGTNIVATKNFIFLPFDEARKKARESEATTKHQYHQLVMTKTLLNMPGNPQNTYKKDWVNWGDFLGTGNISNCKKKFIDFNECRGKARKLNITYKREWKIYCVSGFKPDNIPSHPEEYYKNDWNGWSDFLIDDSGS